jgi:L-amino acid N-acyltransferase YncA
MLIRSVVPTDWPRLTTIYQQGIDTGHATLETKAPSPQEMSAKYLATPQLVAEITAENGKSEIVGYALLSSVSGRCVYGGVAEVSLYIATDYRGKGLGKMLLEQLITASEDAGFWMLQAGIFPENTASVTAHHRAGFRTVGLREKIGKREGIWRDVLLLERRSQRIGVS